MAGCTSRPAIAVSVVDLLPVKAYLLIRQMAGWPLLQPSGREGGKSGLHGRTVPGNARRE